MALNKIDGSFQTIQSAIDFVEEGHDHVSVEKLERMKSAVEIIQKSNAIEISSLKNVIDRTVKLIEECETESGDVLNRISQLEKGQQLLIRRRKKGIKFEVSKYSSNKVKNLFNKIIFKLKQILFQDLETLSLIYQGMDSERHKEQIERSLKSLNGLLSHKTDFFYHGHRIKQDRQIRQVVNVGLEAIGVIEEVQSITFKTPEEITKFSTASDQIGNVLGATIAHSVAAHNPNCIVDGGGFSLFSTAQEIKEIESLLEEKRGELSEDEVEILQEYLRDIRNSFNDNVLVDQVVSQSPDDPDKVRSLIKNVARRLHDKISSLEEGESHHMDVGYLNHSMRAVFKREGKDITAHLFDTSGALEAWEGNLASGLLRRLSKNKEFVCMALRVSAKDFDQHGREHLEQVLEINSPLGFQAMENMNNMIRYTHFMRTFKSIYGGKQMVSRQPIQTANNCFAKRLEATKLHYLGGKQYARIRLHSYNMLEGDLLESAEGFLTRKDHETLKNYVEKLENDPMNSKQFKKVRKAIDDLDEIPIEVEGWKRIFDMYYHDKAILQNALEEADVA